MRPPALALSDLEGVSHDPDDYRGRVVLVNFWATWCLPCLREMPGIQSLQQAPWRAGPSSSWRSM
jgi:thiol-disulfide isomerase/thioredoxin